VPVLLSARTITLEFADLFKRRPIVRPAKPSSRYPGAHQSDILAYIARKIGELKPGEELEEDMPWRMAMGNMWEEFYFSLLPDSDWQPGEIVQDGIAVNADGITSGFPVGFIAGQPDGRVETIIEETKCTEKKFRTGDQFLSEWMWMHQGRAYCYVYGPRIVRWTVMFYRGDYRGSGPIVGEYIVEFSDKEVQQTWGMLKVNKTAAMDQIKREKREKELAKPTEVALPTSD